MQSKDKMPERLQKIMDDHGLMKKEMAEAIGVSSSTMLRYLWGSAVPNDHVIANICSVFHVSFSWLFHGEGDPYVDGYQPGGKLGEKIYKTGRISSNL